MDAPNRPPRGEDKELQEPRSDLVGDVLLERGRGDRMLSFKPHGNLKGCVGSSPLDRTISDALR